VQFTVRPSGTRGKDSFGRPYVTLNILDGQPGFNDAEVRNATARCFFRADQMAPLAELKPGRALTIRGICAGITGWLRTYIRSRNGADGFIKSVPTIAFKDCVLAGTPADEAKRKAEEAKRKVAEAKTKAEEAEAQRKAEEEAHKKAEETERAAAPKLREAKKLLTDEATRENGKMRLEEVAREFAGTRAAKEAESLLAAETRKEAELQKADKRAAPHLKYAKKLVVDDMREKAKERLQEIIKKFPGTNTAKEASKLLEQLR
jgi:hypothetical protein